MAALAAFATLLFRYSGQRLRHRRPRAPQLLETEGMVGLFVNMLPLRADPGAPTFRTPLRRAGVRGAHAHQDPPFEQLVEHLQPQRDPSRSPIFQVMPIAYDTPATSSGRMTTLEPMMLDTRSAVRSVALRPRGSRHDPGHMNTTATCSP